MEAEFCDSFALIRMSSLIISYYDIKWERKELIIFRIWMIFLTLTMFIKSKNYEKKNILKIHLILIVNKPKNNEKTIF